MRRKRRNQKRQIKIFIGLTICFLLVMTVGYAAFSTTLTLNAKGSIKEIPIAADKLKQTVVTSGDGLYEDSYEEGRYVYKGASPDNYITFNNETWRIMSVETDNTIKIIRTESIKFESWDQSYPLADWPRPAYLNTYLNDYYYNSLTEEAKALIASSTYKIGGVSIEETSLEDTINSENSKTWDGKIALITASEYVKAGNNGCEMVNNYWMDSNYPCDLSKNWLTVALSDSWLLTPIVDDQSFLLVVDGYIYSRFLTSDANVMPVTHLKADIALSGKGTESSPYTIKND